MLASSQHKQDAEAFVAWIAGPKGQAILRDGTSFEYAVGKGEASNPKLEPLDKLQAPDVAADRLNAADVSELMTEAGLI